jgi:hypothetical protein
MADCQSNSVSIKYASSAAFPGPIGLVQPEDQLNQFGGRHAVFVN